MEKPKWEEVLSPATERLKVPRGWLIRTKAGGMSYTQGASVCVIFYEDINHEWTL